MLNLKEDILTIILKIKVKLDGWYYALAVKDLKKTKPKPRNSIK